MLTWPLAVVRPLLVFVFRGKGDLIREAMSLIGPIVGLGAAGSVLGLCAFGRRDARAFLTVGGLSGLLIGGASFATTEVLQSSCDVLFCRAKLFVGVLAGGGFWAAPIAVPVGVLAGGSVFLLGKLLGVVQPAWLADRPRLRPVAVVAFVGAQALYGLCLRNFLA